MPEWVLEFQLPSDVRWTELTVINGDPGPYTIEQILGSTPRVWRSLSWYDGSLALRLRCTIDNSILPWDMLCDV